MKHRNKTYQWHTIRTQWKRRRHGGYTIYQDGALRVTVHETALIHDTARLGDGTYVSPRATIHAHAVVRAFSIVCWDATIGHAALIGECARIPPGCAVGPHATIKPHTGTQNLQWGARIPKRIKFGPNDQIKHLQTFWDTQKPNSYLHVIKRPCGLRFITPYNTTECNEADARRSILHNCKGPRNIDSYTLGIDALKKRLNTPAKLSEENQKIIAEGWTKTLTPHSTFRERMEQQGFENLTPENKALFLTPRPNKNEGEQP